MIKRTTGHIIALPQVDHFKPQRAQNPQEEERQTHSPFAFCDHRKKYVLSLAIYG